MSLGFSASAAANFLSRSSQPTQRDKISQTKSSEKKKLYEQCETVCGENYDLDIDSLITFFVNNMKSSTWGSSFYSNCIPDLFLDLSKLIEESNTNKIITLINGILKISEFLERADVQTAIYNKEGKDFLLRCQVSLCTMAEYISHFYTIKSFTENKCTSVERPILGREQLLKCFEETKHLTKVQEGLTSAPQPKYGSIAKEGAQAVWKKFEESGKKGDSLSQGGYHHKSTLQKICSRETIIGILGFCAGGIGQGAVGLPGFSLGENIATVVGCNALMVFGFATMLSYDTGMGYKFELQQMLLRDIYKSVCHQYKSQGNPRIDGLSDDTRRQLKEFLTDPDKKIDFSYLKPKIETLHWYGPKVVLEEERQYHYSTADAEILFKKLLSRDDLTFNNIKTELEKLNLENRKFFLTFLRKHVTKEDEQWGTALDHLFAKLSETDKGEFIKNLQEKKIFGFSESTELAVAQTPSDAKGSSDVKFPASLEGKNGAINYVYNIMKNTDWSDRIVGTQVFSELLLDIYSSGLNAEEQKFLLEMMIGKELEGGNRGEFASGQQKRANKKGYGVVSLLYTLTGISAYVASFFATPLAIGIVKLITNACGASAFGLLGVQSGNSTSHKSKMKALEASKGFVSSAFMRSVEKSVRDNLSSTNESSFKSQYEDFLKELNKLKEFDKDKKDKNASNNYETIVNNIIHYIDQFQQKGVLQFALEANHAEKDCPLFVIVENLLKNKALLDKAEKLGADSKDGETQQGAFQKINEIICKLYNQDFLSENINKLIGGHGWSNISFDTLTEDSFSAFISNGFKAAKTSKDKFLFALQCCAALHKMKENDILKHIYPNCTTIFCNAVKNAAIDQASFLFDLQKRHSQTYAIRRSIARAIANLFTVGAVFVILAVVLSFPLSSPYIFIGSLCFFPLDFFFRKLGEWLQYSKSYRNYKTIDGIVDMMEDHAKKIKNQENTIQLGETKDAKFDKVTEKITPKEALEKISNFKNETENKKKIIEELEKCLTWEINFDNKKLDKIKEAKEDKDPVELLRQEVNLILEQGFDKDSALRAIVRAQRLILLCKADKVSLNDKSRLLCELANLTCLNGKVGDIIQTKSTFLGRGLVGLVDLFFGFFLRASGFASLIPGLEGVFCAEDGTTQDLGQFGASFGLDMGFNVFALYGWIRAWDVSYTGKTDSFKYALGAIKKSMLLYCSPEELKGEKENKIKELEDSKHGNDDHKKKNLEKNYKDVNLFMQKIFAVRRKNIPFQTPNSLENFKKALNVDPHAVVVAPGA